MQRGIRIATIAASAALLLTTVIENAEAQGLGRLGRAVKDRIEGTTSGQAAANGSSSDNTATASGPAGAGLSAARLDGLAAGLRVEAARRSELAAELASLQSRPDYEQCRFGFSMSPQGMAAATAYGDAVTAYYAEAQNPKKQQAMEEAQRSFEAATRKACGAAPDEAERVRRERQGEPEKAGAERAGVDGVTYARMKEVVLPFCVAEAQFEAGRAASIPSGAGKSFSYSAEDTLLLKSRCAELLPLLQAVL